MTGLAAPLYVITGVLALAGAAKVGRPSPTATALRALRVPAPLISARVLGALEIVLAVSAIVFGAAILWAGIAVAYAAFTGFILWALNGNQDVASCGCFGHDDTPPTVGHAAFNAAAAAIAGLAVVEPVRLGDFDGNAIEAVLSLALVATGIALAVASLTSLPRTLALARGTAKPSTPTFSLNTSPTQGQR